MNPIEAIADAIQPYEGYSPSSRSYRNRNPGNLRCPPNCHGEVEVCHDKDFYRIFKTFIAGRQELETDLLAKFNGSHGLTLTNLNHEPTLQDLFFVYAPVGDNNNPGKYSAFVAHWLSLVFKKYIEPTTTLKEIKSLT